jgi:hypothetical protein
MYTRMLLMYVEDKALKVSTFSLLRNWSNVFCYILETESWQFFVFMCSALALKSILQLLHVSKQQWLSLFVM